MAFRAKQEGGDDLSDLLGDAGAPDEIRDGVTAERILEDPVYQRAVQAARDTFTREWAEGLTVEVREAAHAKVHALAQVDHELRRILSAGTMARARADRGW